MIWNFVAMVGINSDRCWLYLEIGFRGWDPCHRARGAVVDCSVPGRVAFQDQPKDFIITPKFSCIQDSTVII